MDTGTILFKKKNTVIVDGRHANGVRRILRDEIGESGSSQVMGKAAEAVGEFQEVDALGERRGLIFGRIQSGKTYNLIASLAIAADNGYKFFVVLTSDNIWLYEQTIDRLKESLTGIAVHGKDDWEQKVDTIKTQMDQSVVLVSTKNGKNLNRLINIIKKTGASKTPAVIFDDEADQASLNTNAGKEDDDQSTINGLIDQMRSRFKSRTFVQVTATPQALFLQGKDQLYRPEFTVLTEPGEGYVGGSIFFGDEDYEHLLVEVAEDEIEGLKSAKTGAVNKSIPAGLKHALCTFFVGATIKSLKNYKAKSSFLCHVSLSKADHEHIRSIIQKYVDEIVIALRDEKSKRRDAFEKQLYQAYTELHDHVEDIPSFEEILDLLAHSLHVTDIQVVNTDSKTGGQPKFNTAYNILIGGTKLGRGVTITGLLVTYYGRQAKKPQADTVLQHARMYGYRYKDLDVSRVFLPENLAQRFREIYESEEALRETISRHSDKGFRGIWLTKNLKATRSNVIDPNQIGVYAAGKSYFPMYPEYKATVVKPLYEKMSHLVQGFSEGFQGVNVISSEQAIELLQHTKSRKNSKGLWGDERMHLALDSIKEDYPQAFLVILRGRNLSQPKGDGGLGAVLSEQDFKHLKSLSASQPAVVLVEQLGKTWDGQPFWIPVVRLPEGNFACVFNLS